MAFYGVEQVLDDVSAYIVSSLGTHLTAVQSAATSDGAVALAPTPSVPTANDIFIASAGVDMSKPLGNRVVIVLRVDTYDQGDRPNGISAVGLTLGLRVSEPSAKTVNTTRRLGRYVDALVRMFNTDATCSTAYIIQIEYPSPAVFGPEMMEGARTPVYQEAFLPLVASIQESAA
jgi:hypothetical protein|tara:strand:+ start:18899 stop:19423 length:525 start_codon:yes stop_codon:yes gene_type:complete